ncbi:hypothetical protein AB832_01350 [Flavobacteriaceae bacterium (ex Bugula neritina AB1)]|nr:hypothetical protein AB832_01350 [Flavobacteriaceae bacterium (ex Bugula neritina AB1)]
MNKKYIIKRVKGREEINPTDLELIGTFEEQVTNPISGYTGIVTVNGGATKMNFVDGLLKGVEQFS